MRTMRSGLALACLALLAVGAVSAADAGAATGRGTEPSPPDPFGDLESVLAGFDEVQGSIHSLSARFTETTESELLKEPLVARGRLYMTKPASLMWEYSSPERMKFVISDDQYVGYFPARKRAERRDIRRWSDQIFRLFGLGQASGELKKFYDIRLEEPDGRMTDTHVLVLEPKKRRVKKRMESVRIWVTRSGYLPSMVEYRDRSGSTRVVSFEEFDVNPELSANWFELDIPPDVTVTTGFSGLGGIGAGR